MSSKTRKTIEVQKGFYESAFQKRQAELKTLESDDSKISKNPKLRHLKAKVRQANKRLLAVSKIEKQIEELASRKRGKADKKLEEPKSSKKSAPQPSKMKANPEYGKKYESINSQIKMRPHLLASSVSREASAATL